MYHIDAHLLCSPSVGAAARRGMLQFPQKTSSTPNFLPHTRHRSGSSSGFSSGGNGAVAGSAAWSARVAGVAGLAGAEESLESFGSADPGVALSAGEPRSRVAV